MAEPEDKTKESTPQNTLSASINADGTDRNLEDLVENEDYIIYKAGCRRKSLHKHSVFFEIPNIAKWIEEGRTLEDLDKWWQDKRNMSAQDAMVAAGRKIATQPDYTIAFDYKATPTKTPDGDKPPFVDYPLKPNGHSEMQKMADAWRAGQRSAASATQKAQAQKLQTMEERAAAAGTTLEELLAKLEKAKAKASKK